MNMGMCKDFKIKDGVLEECYSNASRIVEIPTGVWRIARSVRKQFTYTECVKIPRTVTHIDKDVFAGTVYLLEIYYDGTMADWCKIDFGNIFSNPVYSERTIYMKDANDKYYEVQNREIIIPDGVDEIKYTFSGFRHVDTVICPDTLRTIGVHAFESCCKLRHVHMGTGLTSIGMEAFGDCDSLEKIEFGPNVKRIGGLAFAHCSSLREIALPDGIEDIESSAFIGCTDLERIFIPKTLKAMLADVFEMCTAKIFYEGSQDEIAVFDGEVDIVYNCTKEMFDEIRKI